MKNVFYLLFFLIFIPQPYLIAQAPISVSRFGGTGTETITDYYRDNAGNQYITGSFEGTVDFDPSNGTFNLIANTPGPDIFLARYSSGGVLKFAMSIGGTANDEGSGIAVDANGNVYLTGYFMDQVDFDPGPSAQLLNSQVNPDGFILKVDSLGNFISVKQLQGFGEVLPTGIAMDATGNSYIGGRFIGACNFDPGNTNFTLNGSSSGDPALFFAKYDSNGNLQFAKEINGSGIELMQDFHVDANQQIYMTGYFQSAVDFDPSGNTSILTATGAQDAYFAKYDGNGNFMLAKSLSGPASEEGYSITTDQNGNIIVAGSFDGTVDFDPGPGVTSLTASTGFSVYLSKFDSNGNLLFAKGFGEGRPKVLKCDQYNNIYMGGFYSGVYDFDPSASALIDTAYGGIDMFIARYQSDGSLGFAWRFGGTSGDEIADIEIDLSSGIYISGNFSGGISLTVNSAVPAYTSNGSFDMFFAKYTLYGNIEVRQGPFILPDFFGNYYYGTVAPGGSSGFKQFEVKNTGTGLLTLTGVKKVNLYGPDASEFTLDTSQIVPIIGPGQIIPFEMSFNPTSTAIKTALVQIKNSGGSASNYLFHANGNSEPEVDIRNSAQVSIPNTTGYNFGIQNIGANTNANFFIYNTGNDTLNILSNPKVKITGLHTGDFTVTMQPLGTQVLSGGNFMFTVKFSPLDTGLRSAQMVIESNDLDEYVYTINLSGNGAAGVLKVFLKGNEILKSSTVALDTMNAMAVKSHLFTMVNVGNDTINLTGNPTIGMLYQYNDFSINITGITTTILPGDSTHFTLNCTPDSAGFYQKSISIQNNGPGLAFGFNITLFARDTVIPRMLYATSTTPDGTYSTGNEIDIRVVFSEPVLITGIPSLKLNSGGTAVQYVQYPSLKDYEYRYVVGSTDSTPDLGIKDTLSFLLNNGTITDTSGNALYPFVPAPSFTSDNVIIDHNLPTALLTTNASSPDHYNNFEVYIHFNEPMFGFTQSDISITNGRIENLTAVVTGQHYLLEISPVDTGNILIYLVRGVAVNANGIQNTPSNRLVVHALIDVQRIVWNKGWGDRLHFNTNLTPALPAYTLKTVIDPSNNYFMVGSLYANGDFDPSSATDTINTQLKRSILLTKYTEDGLLLWTKLLQSNSNNILRDAVCDQSGNLYIAGVIFDTLDLDPGPGVAQIFVEGYADGFISKYDSNGNYLWSFKIGNAADVYGTGIFSCFDFVTSICFNQNNELLVAGAFRGTVDFDPGAGVVAATSITAGNAFFAKYSNNGTLLFAKPFDLLEGANVFYLDEQLSITTDLSNNIYLAGKFRNTVDLDPGPQVQSFTSSSHYAFFFAKYTNNGDFEFAKQLQGTNIYSNAYNAINGIEVDQQERIFICGNMGSTFDFDPGPTTFSLQINAQFETNIFLAGYDSTGNLRFAKQCGRTGTVSNFGRHRVNGMSIDNNSRIYIVGTYDQGGADFFGKILYTWGTSGGWSGYDSFFAITDSSGNALLIKGYQVFGLYDYLSSVSIDQQSKPLIAGVIDANIDLSLSGNQPRIMNCPRSSSVIKCKYTELETNFSLQQGPYVINNGDTYSFGNINVGGNSGYKTFTITNTGDLKLFLTGTPRIAISGPNAAEFNIAQGATASSLEGSISTTFQINYQPAAAGIRTATITILNSDPDVPSFQFTITGGELPEIDIQESSVSIASGSTFTFPATNQFTAATRTFTVLNTGLAPLLFSANNLIALSGTNVNDFSFDTSTTARILMPGVTTTFDLIFLPTSTGTKNATNTLVNNDNDESNYQINLSGTGLDTQSPQVLFVSSPTVNGYYNVPDSIDISVHFNENVALTGSATLTLNTGANATYITGSGNSILYFRYYISANQNTPDLNYTGVNALQLSGGSCSDAGGNAATLTLPPVSSPASLGESKHLVVDTYSPVPVLSVLPGPYAPAIPYNSQVTFNESVLGFQQNDIQVTNGSISNFQSDPLLKVYDFDLTPIAQGLLQFNIPASITIDSAGNPNLNYGTSLNITSETEEHAMSNKQLVVFPNPTNSLMYYKGGEGKVIQLYDLMGRVLLTSTLKHQDDQIGVLDLSQFSTGIYLLRLGSNCVKVIKE
jgi:hypothetical protein